MAKLAVVKTKPTGVDVNTYINGVENEQKREDSLVLLEMMQKLIPDKPKMWGGSIVGFGYVIVKSPTSGREVEWFKIGFSPRKTNLSLYLGGGLQAHADALKKLGKHKTGVGCIYINKLSDVDLDVLNGMFKATLMSA
jgi:hypothetical protein